MRGAYSPTRFAWIGTVALVAIPCAPAQQANDLEQQVQQLKQQYEQTTKDLQQRIKLESKDDMKRRLSKAGLDSSSPDDADALALTFAMPVRQKKAVKPKGESSHRNDGLGWLS